MARPAPLAARLRRPARGPAAPLAALALAALAGCGAPPAPSDRPAAAPTAALWFAGDVHLGAAGQGALGPLGAALAPAAGVVNLEGPIDARASAGAAVVREPGALRLFNAPVVADELAAAGVVAAGVANNHAGDAGPEGQDLTARSLRAAGVAAFGGAAGVAVIERGGLRVALAGFDLGAGVPPGLEGALAAARGQGDVLAVGFHTTGPPLYLPEPPLREAAAAALAAGASVVVAHGSHAVAGAELRGRAVVAWGLGNAAFACECTDEREGLALRVRLGPGGVDEAALVPIDAGLQGAPARLAADPDALLDLLGALAVRGRRLGDRLVLLEATGPAEHVPQGMSGAPGPQE